MRAQLSNRDYEQLSAYIDGQLAPAERRKLEERLRAHTDLQAALDEMSRTRALLRSAPRRRAPRNFTLTPAMVGAQKPGRSGSWWNLFPVLSFTSALATLALVATIVFQLLPAQKAAQTAAMQQPAADRVADIVQRTMTAMQASAPTGAAAPLQSSRAINPTEVSNASPATEKPAAPGTGQSQATTQPPAAALPAPTATAQPATQATASLDQAATAGVPNTPPVVGWGNSTGPAGATGLGGGAGGAGGAGGQGPNAGSLLGPPAVTSPDTVLGKGGGGGAGPEQQITGNIVIPQESVNSQGATTLAQPETTPSDQQAPAPVNPAITGTGPILGVPSQGEGGQIVGRKAILGQPGPAQQANAQPAEETVRSGEQTTAMKPQTLFGLPVILVIQGLLALIAAGAAIAAFIVRKRAR